MFSTWTLSKCSHSKLKESMTWKMMWKKKNYWSEVDLSDTKEALRKEKEILKEKEKAINDLIRSQKQKALEESKTVEELKATKAHQDLETKINALEAEVEKVKAKKNSKINVGSNVKQEPIETNIEEKQIAIPCKYFHTIKGCRRGSKCLFSHEKNHKTDKKNKKVEEKHK